MRIQCPECQFERELNPDKIPASAQMATCPRCGHRFKFREAQVFSDADSVEGAHESSLSTQASSQSDESAISSYPAEAQERESRLPTEKEGDDPLPPDALVVPQKTQSSAQEAHKSRLAAEPEQPLRSASASQEEQGEARNVAKADIPWELPEHYGLIDSMYQTILRVLFAAPRFFAELPRARGTLIRPAIFFILIGTVQAMMERMWVVSRLQALSEMGDANAQAGLAALSHNMSVGVLLVSMPFLLLLQWLIYAGLFNLMVRLVEPEKANFEVVLRIVAYSAAPGIISIIPWVGSYTASLWFMVSCFMGVRYALGLSWSRTAMALVPLFMLAFVLGMHAVKLLMSGAG